MHNLIKNLFIISLLINCYSYSNRFNEEQWFIDETSYLKERNIDKKLIEETWNYILSDKVDLSIDSENEQEYNIKFLGHWKNSYYTYVRVYNQYSLIQVWLNKKIRINDPGLSIKNTLRNNIEKGQNIRDLLWIFTDYNKSDQPCGKNCDIYFFRENDVIYEGKFIKDSLNEFKVNQQLTQEYKHKIKINNLNICIQNVHISQNSTRSALAEIGYAAAYGGSGKKGNYQQSWDESKEISKNEKIRNCYQQFYPELYIQNSNKYEMKNRKTNYHEQNFESSDNYQKFQYHQRGQTKESNQNFQYQNPNENACSSDFNCNYGQKCVKSSLSSQGECADVVDSYGNKLNNYTPSTDSIYPGKGSCSFDNECPTGFRCHKATGSLYGNCLK